VEIMGGNGWSCLLASVGYHPFKSCFPGQVPCLSFSPVPEAALVVKKELGEGSTGVTWASLLVMDRGKHTASEEALQSPPSRHQRSAPPLGGGRYWLCSVPLRFSQSSPTSYECRVLYGSVADSVVELSFGDPAPVSTYLAIMVHRDDVCHLTTQVAETGSHLGEALRAHLQLEEALAAAQVALGATRREVDVTRLATNGAEAHHVGKRPGCPLFPK
jgi:hypothetical protein